ncbi:MAG TPA: hypothetical protein O0X27_02585 [Methanocorpusculum sp.]|nr:hypothetical protein [Methanocorpusculum sp.]
MKPTTILYTGWSSVDTLPTEEKLLKKALEDGRAAIVADTGLGCSICGISEDAVNSGTVLFIRTAFWTPELFYSASRLDALQAVGYLAMDETEDAGTVFYNACIGDSIAAADRLWNRQCRFNENYSGYVIVDGDAKLELQGCFPDCELAKKLLKIIARNEKRLKEDIRKFEAATETNIAAYRAGINSSHLTGLSDDEYRARFAEDRRYLLDAYRRLKVHVKEMQVLPELFGSRNYLLRGGRYRDIPGVCKRVAIADIEAKNWSLNPDDYL